MTVSRSIHDLSQEQGLSMLIMPDLEAKPHDLGNLRVIMWPTIGQSIFQSRMNRNEAWTSLTCLKDLEAWRLWVNTYAPVKVVRCSHVTWTAPSTTRSGIVWCFTHSVLIIDLVVSWFRHQFQLDLDLQLVRHSWLDESTWTVAIVSVEDSWINSPITVIISLVWSFWYSGDPVRVLKLEYCRESFGRYCISIRGHGSEQRFEWEHPQPRHRSILWRQCSKQFGGCFQCRAREQRMSFELHYSNLWQWGFILRAD